MANGDRGGADVVKTLGLVVGLLAGFLALLYAVGGGVLALRLFLEGLPSLTVVGQLPREYLISIGLTQIVLPGLAAAALYAAVRLLVGSAARSPERFVRQWQGGSWRDWTELGGISVLLAVAATVLGVSPAIAREGLSGKLLWLLAVAFLLTLLVMLVALRLRTTVATRHAGTWNALRPATWMTLVVALATLPSCTLFAGTFHLLDAKVCTTEDSESGVLIGETADRVYIGESGGMNGPRRVVSVPLSQVEKLFIGGQAATKSCS